MLSAWVLVTLLVGSSCAQEYVMGLGGLFIQLGGAATAAEAAATSSQLARAHNSAREALKKKCTDNHATEAFDNLHGAQQTLEACVKRQVNISQVQEEMKEARPEGRLDEVFKKYCDRKGLLQQCLRDFTGSLEPCLTPSERDNLRIVHNITQQIAEFVCYRDGDRIALFIEEHGPECFGSQSAGIQECARKHSSGLAGYRVVSSVSDIPANNVNFEFTAEECDKARDLQTCVVNKLTQCDQPTPSNIAESFFKYVIKATPCNHLTNKAST